VSDKKERTEAQLTHHKRGRKRRKKWDHRMVHGLVAKIAKSLAGAYYEHAASHDDQFYAYYPSQKFFIDYEWHRFITSAKSTMTTMLGSNSVPEAQKQEIYHALLLDATLPYSQQETQVTNIPN